MSFFLHFHCRNVLALNLSDLNSRFERLGISFRIPNISIINNVTNIAGASDDEKPGLTLIFIEEAYPKIYNCIKLGSSVLKEEGLIISGQSKMQIPFKDFMKESGLTYMREPYVDNVKYNRFCESLSNIIHNGSGINIKYILDLNESLLDVENDVDSTARNMIGERFGILLDNIFYIKYLLFKH